MKITILAKYVSSTRLVTAQFLTGLAEGILSHGHSVEMTYDPWLCGVFISQAMHWNCHKQLGFFPVGEYSKETFEIEKDEYSDFFKPLDSLSFKTDVCLVVGGDEDKYLQAQVFSCKGVPVYTVPFTGGYAHILGFEDDTITKVAATPQPWNTGYGFVQRLEAQRRESLSRVSS